MIRSLPESSQKQGQSKINFPPKYLEQIKASTLFDPADTEGTRTWVQRERLQELRQTLYTGTIQTEERSLFGRRRKRTRLASLRVELLRSIVCAAFERRGRDRHSGCRGE